MGQRIIKIHRNKGRARILFAYGSSGKAHEEGFRGFACGEVIIKPMPVGEPHRLFHLAGRLPLGCMYANWSSHPSVWPKASQKEISKKYCACTCGGEFREKGTIFSGTLGLLGTAESYALF